MCSCVISCAGQKDRQNVLLKNWGKVSRVIFSCVKRNDRQNRLLKNSWKSFLSYVELCHQLYRTKRQAKCGFEQFLEKVSGAMWSCVISCVGGWPQEPTSASAANEFGRKDNRVRRCRIIDDDKNDDKDENFDLLLFFPSKCQCLEAGQCLSLGLLVIMTMTMNCKLLQLKWPYKKNSQFFNVCITFWAVKGVVSYSGVLRGLYHIPVLPKLAQPWLSSWILNRLCQLCKSIQMLLFKQAPPVVLHFKSLIFSHLIFTDAASPGNMMQSSFALFITIKLLDYKLCLFEENIQRCNTIIFINSSWRWSETKPSSSSSSPLWIHTHRRQGTGYNI